jgi:hypothetical protein
MRSDRGSLFKANPGIGYRINFSNDIAITPVLGYGFSTQKLYLLDNGDLNSTYVARWSGSFGGINFRAKIASQLFVLSDISYHQINYHAEANWNLIQSFQHPKSFEHTAKGFGVEANAAFGFRLSSVLALKFGAGFSKWTTGAGVDQLYLADGSTLKTRLNDVSASGYSINIGAIYTFR